MDEKRRRLGDGGRDGRENVVPFSTLRRKIETDRVEKWRRASTLPLAP
jgi:hypothetical protein